MVAYPSKPVTQEDLARFVAAAQDVVDAYYGKKAPNQIDTRTPRIPQLQVDPGGKKYARIVARDPGVELGGSAWAFVELATGFILKADGWKRPAPQPRGTIHDATYGAAYVGPFGPAYLR